MRNLARFYNHWSRSTLGKQKSWLECRSPHYSRFLTYLLITKEYISKNTKILDIGCGEGNLLSILPTCRKFGMDISKRYVEQAKSKNRTALIKIADIEKKFPFPDRFFDIVYCTEVLEHVNKPADVLGEIFRVTSTNGIVILSTYNHFCFPNLITFNAFKDKYISSDHLREYSYFSFKNEFENYFEIMNFQSTGCEWKRLKKFFSTHKRIYRFFARFPIFNFLIFKLRKNEV